MKQRRTSADVAKTLLPELKGAVSSTRPVGDPFPLDTLPEPIARFVREVSTALGCAVTFVVPHVLAVLGAAIGTTRRIEMKSSWREYPIVWACIVADSGTLKSPAMAQVLRPLHERQRSAIRRYEREREEYKAKRLDYERQLTKWKRGGPKADGPPPEEPVPPILEHLVVSDTTVEALAVRLADQPRGLLLSRDELSGLFAFDAYKAAKGNDAAHYLEMHRGGVLKVDRKTGDRTTIYVPAAALSISGTIQPPVLARVLGRQHFENGLAARFLFSKPPNHAKRWSKATISPDTAAIYKTVVDRLYELAHDVDLDGERIPRDLTLSVDAEAVWGPFYDEFGKVQVDASDADRRAAYAKLECAAARLALIVHCVRHVIADPTLESTDRIDAASMRAGIALARWYVDETDRVYHLLAESSEDRAIRELVELIGRHGGAITSRALTRASRGFPTVNDAEQALVELVSAGRGYWSDKPPGPQGGRPTREFRLVDGTSADETIENPEESVGSVDLRFVDRVTE